MTDEKTIFTTLEGDIGRKAVAAMQELLNQLRELPGWGNRKNGITIAMPDGSVAEVFAQSGSSEAFIITIVPKAD